MELDNAIRTLAATQHGLISRQQLRAATAVRDDVRHRLRKGMLQRLSPCVFRIAGSPDTPAQRALAAVLDVGEQAVLSHTSAAAWWQIPGFGLEPGHATSLRGGRLRASHLATVHQPRALTSGQMTTLHGVPVTSPARTIFDLAAREHPMRVERALDCALSHRLTNNAEMHHMLRVLARRGRSGITTMRQLLLDRPPDERLPDSNLERRFRRIAAEAGYRELQAQFDIADETGWLARVDFYYAPLRLVIEIDSVIHHSALTDRRRDDATTDRLIAAGYTVRRFTEVEIFFEPERVIAALRSAFWQHNVG
jgi:predicted transcriptional regulator of viral defense system